MAAYADRTKLAQLGTLAAAVVNVPTAAQDEALEARSRFVDGYLKKAGYVVPVNPTVNAGEAVTLCVCILAAYDCITTRGHNPNYPDEEIRRRYLDMLEWLKMVASGEVDPGVIDDTVTSTSRAPEFFSDPIRGWTARYA